jgi:hypothetical protein
MDITVREPELIAATVSETETANEISEAPVETTPTPSTTTTAMFPRASDLETGTKVSALSLASIRAKRELDRTTRTAVKDSAQLPTEPFTETDMLLQWTKYAQRLGDKGHKIMESLLLINDPRLEGTTIIHELPNEGSKIDFETEKLELLGYLRGKLHNHDISIEIVVNEQMDSRKAFTPQDKFNRLNELNPALEILRKTFDLDL